MNSGCVVSFIVIGSLFFAFVGAEPGTKRQCFNSRFDGNKQKQLCYTVPDPADNTPQQIEPGLWIGNQYSAENAAFIVGHGITNILSALGKPNKAKSKQIAGIGYLYLDIEDGDVPHMFQTLIAVHQQIEDVRNKGGVVLIHCAAGVSRSATIAIAHLMQRHGYSLQRAENRVRKARHIIQPNKWFQETLVELEQFVFGTRDAKLASQNEDIHEHFLMS